MSTSGSMSLGVVNDCLALLGSLPEESACACGKRAGVAQAAGTTRSEHAYHTRAHTHACSWLTSVTSSFMRVIRNREKLKHAKPNTHALRAE